MRLERQLKVLVINPPLRVSKPADIYPLGLCYVAAYLIESGIKVQILDLNAYRWTKNQFAEIFKKSSCDAVGIGGLVTAFNHVDWIARHVKEVNPHLPIFAGNTVSSTIPEILLRNTCVDVAVIGEGELTTLELVERLENNESLEGLKGIWYKDAKTGKLHENPQREPITDIDALPFPAWDLVPMDIYIRNFKETYGFRGIATSTVRGCPYNCSFCCKTFIGYRVRSRSPENMIEELQLLLKKYRIEGFLPCDDLFTYDRNRTVKFCDLLVKNNLHHLRWIASSRANLLTIPLAQKLKAAGCISLNFGFESHSQEVLDYYNKQITVRDQQNVIDICKKVGISFAVSYIVGAQNEDEKTLEETYRFCKKNHLRFNPSNLLMPQPQTKIYRECIERGIIRNELEYIKKMASAGDADRFLVNVTEKLSDEELIAIFSKYRESGRSRRARLRNMAMNPRYYMTRLRGIESKAMLRKLMNLLKKEQTQEKTTRNRNEWR